jgi:hypothetical protein
LLQACGQIACVLPKGQFLVVDEVVFTVGRIGDDAQTVIDAQTSGGASGIKRRQENG